MTDFNSLSFSELCDRLCENKRTLIVYHVRSDADAVGSAFALREILCLMGIPTLCANFLQAFTSSSPALRVFGRGARETSLYK